MAKTMILAWRFETDLVWLRELKKLLDAAWSTHWVELDSDSKADSISKAVTDHAWVRIYLYGKGYFVANIVVKADDADLAKEMEVAKELLFARVLPVLDARNVKETKPVED
jgi:hypothetical protein